MKVNAREAAERACVGGYCGRFHLALVSCDLVAEAFRAPFLE